MAHKQSRVSADSASKKDKKKKKEIKQSAESLFVKNHVAFQVIPTPFALLGEEGRRTILGQFEGFLNAIDSSILIYINPEWERFVIDGEKYYYMDLNYYIITDKDKMDVIEGFFDTKASYEDEFIAKYVFSQRPIVTGEFPSYVTVKKRKKIKTPSGEYKEIWSREYYGRAYMLCGLGTELPPGVMLDVIKFIEDAMMYIEPVDDSTAFSYADKARMRLQSLLSEKASLSIQARAQRLDLLASRIMAGTKIHKFSLIFTVVAKDPQQLKMIEDKYVKRLRKYYLIFDAPLFVQGPLFEYKFKTKVLGFLPVEIIKKITIDSHSLRLFYPFISDNITHPGGIFLGVNPDMNQPIIFDPYSKTVTNYNIVILGETGSGKSMTTKVILRRLLDKHPESYLYIIDPEGEYAEASKLIAPDAEIIRVKPGEPLGLDPIAMMWNGDLDIVEVGEIIADLYSIEKEYRPYLRADLMEAKERKIKTIFDFVEYVSKKKEYKDDERLQANYVSRLRGIIAPPDNAVFMGTPKKISDKTVFDLRAVENFHLKVVISTLISAVLIKKLMVDLPRTARKIFVVDEAWMFTDFPATMSLFNNVSRRGRKRGIIFMFVTQKPDDVVKNEVGKTILMQSFTSILLAQREKGAQILKDLYNLTEDEAKYLTEVTPGHGILRLGDAKTKIYIVVTSKELEVFSTRAIKSEAETETETEVEIETETEIEESTVSQSQAEIENESDSESEEENEIDKEENESETEENETDEKEPNMDEEEQKKTKKIERNDEQQETQSQPEPNNKLAGKSRRKVKPEKLIKE